MARATFALLLGGDGGSMRSARSCRAQDKTRTQSTAWNPCVESRRIRPVNGQVLRRWKNGRLHQLRPDSYSSHLRPLGLRSPTAWDTRSPRSPPPHHGRPRKPPSRSHTRKPPPPRSSTISRRRSSLRIIAEAFPCSSSAKVQIANHVFADRSCRFDFEQTRPTGHRCSQADMLFAILVPQP